MSDATILSLSASRAGSFGIGCSTPIARTRGFVIRWRDALPAGMARIAHAMAFANSKAWSHVAQIVLIDPFTAGVGVGGATENRGWL